VAVTVVYALMTAGFFLLGPFDYLYAELGSPNAALGIWILGGMIVGLAEGRWWVLLISPVIAVVWLPAAVQLLSVGCRRGRVVPAS
jgi:hypothetical protein